MDIASTILGVLVPLVVHFARPSEQGERKLNDLYWQIPLGILGTIFVMRVVIAPYWIFREEEEKRKCAEREREEIRKKIDDNSPKLQATILRYVIGSFVGGGNEVPFVCVLIEISNRGSPSIAENWTMNLQMAGGQTTKGRLQWIRDGLQMHDAGPPAPIFLPDETPSVPVPPTTINSADAIYNRAMTPIQTGGKIVGYLIATFSELMRSQVQAEGNSIIVGFGDVSGCPYSVSATISGPPGPLSKADRYPGEHF